MAAATVKCIFFLILLAKIASESETTAETVKGETEILCQYVNRTGENELSILYQYWNKIIENEMVTLRQYMNKTVENKTALLCQYVNNTSILCHYVYKMAENATTITLRQNVTGENEMAILCQYEKKTENGKAIPCQYVNKTLTQRQFMHKMAEKESTILCQYDNKTAILRQYKTLPNQGICQSQLRNSLKSFHDTYKDCIVIIGNLTLALLEITTEESFKNISFPNLREVTGYVVVYRVNGLLSLGLLFPNLARIRGETLMHNYGLVVHDMAHLQEIGLYGLLKIDRGGVILWAIPEACFINTIDWNRIAPHSANVIEKQEKKHNNSTCLTCRCDLDPEYNRCWNRKYCQIDHEGQNKDNSSDLCLGCRKTISRECSLCRYFTYKGQCILQCPPNTYCQIDHEGQNKDNCSDLCLGCRKTNSRECSLCRYFTYKGQCIRQCPPNTILLPNCQYCISMDECHDLGGWLWNKSCVFKCPVGFVKKVSKGITKNIITCESCDNCSKVCESLKLTTTSGIQAVEPCVYINGSLEIHIRLSPEANEELRKYLSRIREIKDYLLIYGSHTVTTLNFLSSLRKIKGKNLKDDRYSLIIYEMSTLRTLFTPKVIKYLKIKRGTLKVHSNPELCMSEINKISSLFPIQPNDFELPFVTNGYSGHCEDISLKIEVINETSAIFKFVPQDANASYSILYSRLPQFSDQTPVPESCSKCEWQVVNIVNTDHPVAVEVTNLQPATKYTACIETFNPDRKVLARSAIVNFTTHVGIPEPPFIYKLNTTSNIDIGMSWIDHKDYSIPIITHYELDVSLIEIKEQDIRVNDHCENIYINEFSFSLEARGLNKSQTIVMYPPPDYCPCKKYEEILNEIAKGAITEDYLDIRSTVQWITSEDRVKSNTSIGEYHRTLVLTLQRNRTDFIISGLAPYREYRLRLRACTGTNCSRSSRAVMRTSPIINADIPKEIFVTHIFGLEASFLQIVWDPPKVTNGPVLSYTIEVMPKLEEKLNVNLPQRWCVAADKLEHKVKAIEAQEYSVRVCTRSMASNRVCSEWNTLIVNILSIRWWVGVLFGFVLYLLSVVLACRIRRRRSDSIDLEPIVNAEFSVAYESELPVTMVEFEPVMYSIPLRDTPL